MQLGVGLLLAIVVGLAGFMVARGLVGLLRRQWRVGLLALGGVLLFLGYVEALKGAAYLLVPSSVATEGGDGAVASATFQNMSALLSISGWGFPLGLINGVFSGARARRSHPSQAADLDD